jgi:hypothetical protein
MARIKPRANSKAVVSHSEQQRYLKNLHAVQALYSLTSRMNTMRMLGKSYSGERDIYEAFGYPKELEFAHYWALYDRGDISSRVVDAPADASWRLPPTMQEDKDDTNDTDFERAWISLQKRINVIHHLHRADVLSGIGRYGILLMGFDDGQDLSTPVNPGSNPELLYLRAYKENMADIFKVDENLNSPRYGLPVLYNVRIGVVLPTGMASAQKTIPVHYSRIIHVAENTVDNSIFGTPRLKKPYNRLSNIELVAGSSAEMWYRGAFPGINFNLDPEAQVSPDDLSNMNDQIEDYIHNFKRHLKLRGVKIESIAPQVSDPSMTIDIQLKLVSASTGIPMRILLGSERGELASDQDEKNWLDKIVARRLNYCEPFILRPFVNRMMDFGVLPKVADYSIRWPELIDSSELDQASSMERRTKALTHYADSFAAQNIFPPEFFFTKIMKMEPEDARQIIQQALEFIEEEAKQIEEEQRIQREGQRAAQGGNNE